MKNRRDFLKLGAALGAVVAGSSLGAKEQAKDESDELLRGVSDIHIHAAPDIRARLTDELDFARQAKKAGYKAIMYKSNDFSCHDRAYLIQQALGDFEVYGSLCMNDVVGDKVNVIAAKKATETSGKLCRCIFMPTQNASYAVRLYKQNITPIAVLDERGRVLPEVVQVMEICRDANIIFASGHCSPEESLILAQKAKEVGVQKFVITHANSRDWKLSKDQIKKATDLGAFIEYCFLPNLWGKGTPLSNFERASEQEFIDFVKIMPQRSFISTDLGQAGMPNPLEGMKQCINLLLKNEIAQKDIDTLVRINPYHLVQI